MIKETIKPKPKKYSFSGHDSFQCRLLWLKKGYDFRMARHSFNADAAGVILGVGNNMVRSIRYWMRAFGLMDEKDCLNNFAHLIFGGLDGAEPLDPFLEDEATLWLLHYRLVSTAFASTYDLIFNELRKSKIEFTRGDFLNFVNLKLEERASAVSENSITEDFNVFVKMYMNGDGSKEREESFSGILSELELLQFYVKQKDDAKKESENVYYISPSEREDIPEIVILISMLENPEIGSSVDVAYLEIADQSPGSVFAMTRSGLTGKLRSIAARYPFVVLNEQAGIRELQFKSKPSSEELLKKYYASQTNFQSI